MFSEPYKIIFRRFINRLTESGLLIISVALGVGAFAAGGTLFVNVVNQNNEMLNSPTYKEIVVSTRADSDSMEYPVEEKLLTESAILTQSDLEAAQMIPTISYSYIMNNTQLRMINEDFSQQQEQMERNKPSSSGESETSDMQNNEMMNQDFDELMSDSSIIMSDDDELSGYEVTSEFFDAWEITAQYGSLFSSNDYDSTNSLVILGSELAETLVEEGDDISSLIGKRLLAMQGYQTIVGIAEETNSSYDYQFFSPYSSSDSGFGDFRRMFMNTELKFSVSDAEDLESVSSMLTSWFDSEYGEGQVIVSNPRLEAEQTVSRNSGISILLLILAISGLFISSVNIAHILLSRTLRMKKHVGILMALGSTRKQVNKLFSIEALLIIVLGTVLGLLIAIPINNQMQSALSLTVTTNWTIIVSAAVSALLIFAFTLIPIRRFDRIKPADAMRVG